MRVHLDKKLSDGVAIAFFVITLFVSLRAGDSAHPPARCF